ncbi:MAG TPA: type II secretion system protein GspM [Candidatus Acidoferrales bacterium]|nr:type II secretion system protein GspM [Candidatus Acidoferrales bacterium]
MTLQQRDKRALMLLGGAVVLIGIYYFATSPSSSSTKIVAPVESVPQAEQRIAQLRRAAAALPGKERALKQVQGELALREKGLIQGGTAAEAQAQLLQVVRRVAKSEQPPLDLRQAEFGPPKSFGDAYGEVTVSVTTTCLIEQLVSFMADLTAQPELVATEDLRIGAAQPKQKTMPVRLTVSAIVPKRLAPVRKALF